MGEFFMNREKIENKIKEYRIIESDFSAFNDSDRWEKLYSNASTRESS